jgi:dihydroorotase
MVRSSFAAVLSIAACVRPAEPPAPAPAPPTSVAPAIATASPPEPEAAPAAGTPYDLVIAGGRVIDPAGGRDGIFDVAVAGGRIAAIALSIDASRARAVIHAEGLLVTPGLVDIHTHVFHGPESKRYLSGSPLAVLPDDFAPSSCTTTVVDAGSSGHRTFAQLREQILVRSTTRALAFVNIVGWGMRGGAFEQDLGDMDAQATARVIEAHRAEIVGVKVAHYAGPSWEPIARAVVAARATGTRVMVDFGGHVPELSLEELLLRRLGPGDLFTHAYADVKGRTSLVDARGVLHPYVRRAHERGILFDLGYGGASFVFSQAIPAIAQGLPPDTVSSDTHSTSRKGSMHDLVAVLSKLAGLGIPVPDLIRRSTAAAADAIGRPELGRLTEGGVADIAVLAHSSGRFVFTDVKGERIEASQRLSCELLVRDGKVVWDASLRDAKTPSH